MSESFYHYVPQADVDLPTAAIARQQAKTEASTPALLPLPRRQFLKLAGVVGGGLVLGFLLGAPSRSEAAEPAASGDTPFQPNAFVQIRPDGRIILAAHSPEAGQGVKTTLPMLIAEELEVPWEAVTVEQSAISAERFGRQVAGGSGAVPDAWWRLRLAGATARVMLIAAAAQRWGVPVGECTAREAKVHHEGSGKSLTYGELASLAATLPVPDGSTIRLKERPDFRLLGKFVGGVDNRAIVTGQPLFGIDQRLPGLLYAVYVKCPRFRGKPREANLDEVKKLTGVVDAFIVEGKGGITQLQGGVAIVARSTHLAFQAERALRVVWDEADAATESTDAMLAQARELTDQPGERRNASGDFEQALEGAAKVVEAFYTYPFLSHATLEPQNCTAWLHDGKLELWVPSQAPQGIAGFAAGIAGVSPNQVVLHQLRIGGGFGRRLENDYAFEVAAIAKRIDAPVKLCATRESDLQHDYYRVGGAHRFTGGLDAQGKLVALRDRTVTYTNPEREGNRSVNGGAVHPSNLQCPEIPNVVVEEALVPLKVPTGWWRAPGSCSLAWVFQSFIHELATAAGRDHRDFLLEQLGEPRWLGDKSMYQLNTERAIAVIRLATEKADWGTPLGPRQGRGLAFYFSHLGYFAEVAEVTVSERKEVRISRVVVAGDVGMLLNRSGGENQVQGSVIDAISVLAGQEIQLENGAVRQGNFDAYPLLRIGAQPKIEIHWRTSEHSPTGLGEPAFPPLAPAVTNAIFAATGERIRTMPITKAGFRIV